MDYKINITKSIGQCATSWFENGHWRGGMVPCSVYEVKNAVGDLPLYQAMLTAARELWPYMHPAKAALLEGDFSIQELCRVKEPPMKLDCKDVPDELLHFRFMVGTNRYECGAECLFNLLNGIRKVAKAGNGDRFHYERGNTGKQIASQTTKAAKAEQTFAELLRKVLLAA